MTEEPLLQPPRFHVLKQPKILQTRKDPRKWSNQKTRNLRNCQPNVRASLFTTQNLRSGDITTRKCVEVLHLPVRNSAGAYQISGQKIAAIKFRNNCATHSNYSEHPILHKQPNTTPLSIHQALRPQCSPKPKRLSASCLICFVPPTQLPKKKNFKKKTKQTNKQTNKNKNKIRACHSKTSQTQLHSHNLGRPNPQRDYNGELHSRVHALPRT